ncbi:MAG: GntR family transcriptional regulator [Planctomycetaceae bacterium]|nr:GntR family transcriptional regulator [Planctomycetaceae bacterium]
MPRNDQLRKAYDYIQNKLAGGEFEPGQKLSRRKLAEEIGVSPALVQHALGQLERAGLVDCRPQSGTYVREFTVQEYADLCELRDLIEPYAAARAAERINEQQLLILDNSCDRFESWELMVPNTVDSHELWKIHREIIDEERIFHGTILTAAANSLLATLSQSLRLLAQVRHNFAGTTLVLTPNVAAEHRGIVDALRAHDPELARERMLEHLRVGRERFQDRLREENTAKSVQPGRTRKTSATVE